MCESFGDWNSWLYCMEISGRETGELMEFAARRQLISSQLRTRMMVVLEEEEEEEEERKKQEKIPGPRESVRRDSMVRAKQTTGCV